MKKRIKKHIIGCRWLMIAGAALAALVFVGLCRSYPLAVIGGGMMYVSGKLLITIHNWWLVRWHCLKTLGRKKL